MPNLSIKGLVVAACLIPTFAFAQTATDDNGNRYNRDRQYHSEISVTDAYLQTANSRDDHEREHKRKKRHSSPAIVDVRTRREYAAGHPEKGFNVPYPRIDTGNNQDASVFYWEVYKSVARGDTDKALFTLCRTGSRSIDAANILADPLNTANDTRRTAVLPDPMLGDAKPFTNVRNIWEGFVGRELYAWVGSTPDPSIPLDLNNDGVINSDAADVYAHTTDANPDKDGWRNFANLPWTTKIRKSLAYMQDKDQYKCWQNDTGCP